jgi:hypothetical protein
MKRVLVLLLCAGLTQADSSSLNLNLPSSPSSYQSDRIRAGDLDCSNAIGSSTNLEFGVLGVINREEENTVLEPQGEKRDVGVYARITIPIGGPKERINCNTLYKLELQKKRMEIQKMEQELMNLRNQLDFEN